MTVTKAQLKELQKYVEKEIDSQKKSVNPDSARIFDLNILDSNISLKLLSFARGQMETELGTKDKQIAAAWKNYEKSLLKDEPVDYLSAASGDASAILETVEALRKKIHEWPEKQFARNLEERYGKIADILVEIAALKDGSKKLQGQWKKEVVPMPSANAAKILGSIRTEKKAATSRENGKKGGRPRKNSGTTVEAVSRKSNIGAKSSTKAKTPAKTIKKTSSRNSSKK